MSTHNDMIAEQAASTALALSSVKTKSVKKATAINKDTEKPLPEKKKTRKEKVAKPAPEAVSKPGPGKTAAKKKDTAKTSPAKRTVKRSTKARQKKITFRLRFGTAFGQELFLSGGHPLLGNNDIHKAVPLIYFNETYWQVSMLWQTGGSTDTPVTYYYFMRDADGTVSYDWGNDKSFHPSALMPETVLTDTWNDAGYPENAFYTEPFSQVLLHRSSATNKTEIPATVTHVLKVKSPLLQPGQILCVTGSAEILHEWDTSSALPMTKNDDDPFYTLSLDLTKTSFPVAYKYGIFDTTSKRFVCFEDGNNRILFDAPVKQKQHIINDGFAALPNNTWKGAGVAIPVFSLRSNNGWGTGEFADIRLLVDWAKQAGLKLIQVLPVNDTTATHTRADAYPYAAISAFALHPMYLNLEKVAGHKHTKLLQKLAAEKKRLNALSVVDYETVTHIKNAFVRDIYQLEKEIFFNDPGYGQFFEQNKHWLVPYAAFCYLRDEYGTADFNKWPAYRHYHAADIASLAAAGSSAFEDIGLHFFVQYHLHLQLREATAYAHANGIILKGDIAIGVHRNGADTWQHPGLYHMDVQAGAPPDDFAVKGQNWGFPAYNWERMKEDGFAWWKQRFTQMSYYFDAFRIDHILGFFRIWSIPIHAVEGVLGHFVPAIPVHINEFHSKGIGFDHHRYTKPWINEDVLREVFGYDSDLVKKEFLQQEKDGGFSLKPAFATQRQVELHFAALEKDDHHEKVKQGLYDLIGNVLLLDAANGEGSAFHFRIGMEQTSSFQQLDPYTQSQLKALYVDYFFRRQDDFWMKEALQKLPALKRATNMLVCGEDLGMVPSCVPEVMRQLGLLSLEIQRMPKDASHEFFHPDDAPYLSVVTPSTHDMSTIRGWWEENRQKTQDFYNRQLGQKGEAPEYCEAWINRSIVLQHLYSPAMWSIFQLQDVLGMDETLRREDPNEERINVPADPRHYWQYRMHLTLEELQQAVAFNELLLGYMHASGR